MIRLTQSQIRAQVRSLAMNSFNTHFNAMAQAFETAHSRIRTQFNSTKSPGGETLSREEISKLVKAPNPYEGILFPERPVSKTQHGTDVVPDFEKRKRVLTKHFDIFVDKLNSLIGTSYNIAEMQGLREKLTDMIGDRVNFHLPFATGLEDYNGSQYLEAVMNTNRAGTKFVMNGFAQSYARTHTLP